MPETKTTGPRDVFMQLFSIILLYFAAINLGVLLFQYINIYFPDVLAGNFVTNSYNLVRWGIATLIVVFPVYIWIMWFVAKDEKEYPAKRDLRIRKWLLYFTLFVSAGVIIGDLISLIYNFLQGELTSRFILKILVVLVIAAAVFTYYLWLLRRDAQITPKNGIKIFRWTVIVIIAAVIVAGFFIAGSPQSSRTSRLDERRISDLQNIQSQIIYFWQQKNRLPANLNELNDNISGYVPPGDPETGAAYEYRATGSLQFELCANFKTKSALQPQPLLETAPGIPLKPIGSDNWQHDIGKTCFERTIDQQLYRALNSPPAM